MAPNQQSYVGKEWKLGGKRNRENERERERALIRIVEFEKVGFECRFEGLCGWDVANVCG